MLRFLIAGCGALGSAFGGMLKRAGHEVALLGRSRAHMDAVRRGGLRIEGLWGEHTVAGFRVLEGPEEVSPVDCCLVTTKAFDTEEIVGQVAPRLGASRVASLQNGLGNVEAVAAAVGEERTIGGMVIIGFEIPSPGAVRVTVYGGEVLFGRPRLGRRSATAEQARREPDEEVGALVEAIASAGIPCRATGNIEGAIWGKVLYNCALNALGAVLGVPYGELASPHVWALIERVVVEAFAVAAAEGVRLPWEGPPDYLRHLSETQLPATARHRSSMLQDIERGRRTEIDHMNGAVARLGDRHGVEAPVNAHLASLVRFLEARARDRASREGV